MAVGPPGTIYVKTSSNLYTVNTTTGASSSVMSLPNSTDNILENAPDGSLIAGARDGSGTQFYRIDPIGQTMTPLGHSSIAFSAIAFLPTVQAPVTAVPALNPLGLALLSVVLGLAAIAYWRRHGRS